MDLFIIYVSLNITKGHIEFVAFEVIMSHEIKRKEKNGKIRNEQKLLFYRHFVFMFYYIFNL